ALCCCLFVERADTFRTHLRYARRTATSRDVFRARPREARLRRLQRNSLQIDSFRCQAGEILTPSHQRGDRQSLLSCPVHLLALGSQASSQTTAYRQRLEGDPTMIGTLAYLDPGSASMILQMLVGGLAAVAVSIKLFWRRILRFLHIKR